MAVLQIQLFFVALLFLMASCSTNEMLSPQDTSPISKVWKLETIVSSDSVKIFSPDNGTSYSLLFEADGNAYGISSHNHLWGKYTIEENNQAIRIDMQATTKALETHDGELYLDYLAKVYRYEMKNNNLRLYFSEKDYMRYRPVEDESYFREIIPNLMQRE